MLGELLPCILDTPTNTEYNKCYQWGGNSMYQYKGKSAIRHSGFMLYKFAHNTRKVELEIIEIHLSSALHEVSLLKEGEWAMENFALIKESPGTLDGYSIFTYKHNSRDVLVTIQAQDEKSAEYELLEVTQGC